MNNRSRSRKRTPWDNKTELTATQEYVQMHYITAVNAENISNQQQERFLNREKFLSVNG